MMLNGNMKHRRHEINKFIQHIFLVCSRYVETSRKGGCDAWDIPFHMCVPPSQKENLSVTVDTSKLNMKSVMWLQKKKNGAIKGCRACSSKGAVVRQILTLIGILFDYKFH